MSIAGARTCVLNFTIAENNQDILTEGLRQIA